MLFRKISQALSLCAAVAVLLTGIPNAFAADLDFSDQYERIFQIRVVSPDAGSKSSIGSGFQVSADGHIMTNYHVVSAYIDSPESYEIQYAAQDGTMGDLELLDFDVVSDLALLKHPEPAADYFQFEQQLPSKGALAYALGNPGDWGMVMVPGPTNGFVEHSYRERILFSGSLNPGMSGGPSLNANGDVVGVNVATAGSQLSFLVPAKKAQALLNNNRKLPPNKYMAEIGTQIRLWQRPRIKELLDMPWAKEDFMDRPLFGEIRHDFQCWGDTNETDENREIARVSKWCRAGDDVYITNEFDAGQIEFMFRDLQPIKLNKFQFARTQHIAMYADNQSSFEHSTNYRCTSDFVESTNAKKDSYQKVVTCIRAYKKLPNLFDSLVVVFNTEGEKVFKSSLSLSAVEQSQIVAMHKRFIEATL